MGLLGGFLLSASTGFGEDEFLLSEEFVEMHLFDILPGSGNVPDGSPIGWLDTRTIVSDIQEVTSIEVTFDVSTIFNGDLYAYLAHGSGFSVLLNRPGRTDERPFGYDTGGGMNIVFSDSEDYGDVHSYGETVTLGSGEFLTGIWRPDGRNVDPALATVESERTALLSSFTGTNPNDRWTLFVADMSGGSPTTINRWGMKISGVSAIPEPRAYALMLGVGSTIFLLIRRCGRRTAPRER